MRPLLIAALLVQAALGLAAQTASVPNTPGARQAIAAQAAKLPALTQTPSLILPNLRPAYFEASPATPAEARQFEAKKVLFGLLADPDGAAARRDFAQKMGVAPEVLEDAAGALQKHAEGKPALQRQLEDGRRALAASDPAEMAGIFDNGADARTPAPADLDSYLQGKTQRGGARTTQTVRGFREAVFDAGHYDPSMDAELKARGYHAVVVQDPDRADLNRHPDMALRSPKLRWMTQARPPQEYIERLPSDMRRHLHKALKKSENALVEVKPLTAEDFRDVFFPLYKATIDLKPGGKLMVGPDFAEHENLADWQAIYYRDPDDRSKFIGSIIVNLWRDRQFATMSYGGYLPKSRDFELGTRSFIEAMKLAVAHGLPLLSFGMDPNAFGLDANIGLQNAKAKTGMVPFPNGPFQLFKVLDGSAVRQGNNAGKNEGLLYFSLLPGALIDRYLALRTDEEAPQTHHLVGEPFLSGDSLAAASLLTARYLTDDASLVGKTKFPFLTPDGLTVSPAERLP